MYDKVGYRNFFSVMKRKRELRIKTGEQKLAHLDVALGTQIVYLRGLCLVDNLDQTVPVYQVSIMQNHLALNTNKVKASRKDLPISESGTCSFL
jgi:hypothetical protein